MGTALQGLHNNLIVDAVRQGFQSFVSNTNTLTPVTTTPGAGQFLSSVIGRAKIPDIGNDLRASMGVDRVSTQQIYQLQTESGSNGESVWATPNDDRGLVRFVGAWTNSNDSFGQRPLSSASTDFVEVTFYGTGINILTRALANASYGVSVNGGVEAFVTQSSSASAILEGRNYNSNTVVNLVNGLSPGVYTVKIRAAVGTTYVCGFDVLNESSLIKVNPGTAYIDGGKISPTVQQSIVYNSGVTGTRGGRQLIYLKSDGTIGSAFQAVNTSAAFLTAADHTNEELVRYYSPREFGAGRADDFSTLIGSSSGRVFTIEDGTTTLVLTNGLMNVPSGGTVDGLTPATAGTDSILLTFVGTGLDVIAENDSTSGSSLFTLSVDGVSQGTFIGPNSFSPKQIKLVSGLPYGTHTVRLSITTLNASRLYFTAFKIYQPKKPTLPSGAVELADFNVLADYVAVTSAAQGFVSSGILRKTGLREMVYSGTWTASLGATDTRFDSGWNIQNSTSGSYLQYTFFGTGVEYNFATAAGAAAWNTTVTIDGSTSYTGALLQTGSGLSFSAGSITGTSSADGKGRLRITGLTLGTHTIKVLNNTTTFNYSDCFDIITPIHSTKSNLYADLQNTLPIGSQGISDNRQVTPVKNPLPTTKAWAQAFGITNGPTTSSTLLVPCPDMSLTIRTTGGPLDVSWNIINTNGTAEVNYFRLYVDGVPVGTQKQNGNVSSIQNDTSDKLIVPVSAGYHKVDLYWMTGSNTATAVGVNRNITAREL